MLFVIIALFSQAILLKNVLHVLKVIKLFVYINIETACFFVQLSYSIDDVTVFTLCLDLVKFRQTCRIYICGFVTCQLCYVRKPRYQMKGLQIENAYYSDRLVVNNKVNTILELQMSICRKN